MSKFLKLEERPSPALVISLLALFVALGSGAYAANKIGTNQIKNKAVTTKKLAGKAVNTSKLAGKSVKTGKLAGQAVTTGKLAAQAVSGDILQDAAVSESKLAQSAVVTDKIADSAVTNSKLNGTSVGTNKLKDESVTTNKIANGAVTSAKVSSDIPYRRTLQSTFAPGAIYQTLVAFGDAELQGRCRYRRRQRLHAATGHKSHYRRSSRHDRNDRWGHSAIRQQRNSGTECRARDHNCWPWQLQFPGGWLGSGCRPGSGRNGAFGDGRVPFARWGELCVQRDGAVETGDNR